MKTMTEFSAFNLREAHLRAREIHSALQTEGKPAEELEQAKKETLTAFLAEKFKLEGEKLELFLQALEVAEAKPRELENLKRVVVYALNEGEKVPGHLVQRNSHAFGAEYLPSLRPQKQDRREAGSKHSKGKGKGRGKRRGDLKGKRPDGGEERRGTPARDGESGAGGGRGPRRDGRNGPQASAPGARPDGQAAGQRPEGGKGRRNRRPGRGPRAPRQDLPPGHLPVDQAAKVMKSTGIRPVERPAVATSTPADQNSSSDNSVV